MSRPGKDDGYFLIDAVISILLTTLIAGAVLSGVGLVVRHAGTSVDRAVTSIESRNADAEKRMGQDEQK